MNTEQLDKITSGNGFIAALDQSGGSTPTALQFYGVDDDAYANLEAMFDLEEVLELAKAHGVFGTEMRSVIKLANEAGVKAVVDQQFEVLLKCALLAALDELDAHQQVTLTVTLPEVDGLDAELVQQGHEDFDATLDASFANIYEASMT